MPPEILLTCDECYHCIHPLWMLERLQPAAQRIANVAKPITPLSGHNSQRRRCLVPSPAWRQSYTPRPAGCALVLASSTASTVRQLFLLLLSLTYIFSPIISYNIDCLRACQACGLWLEPQATSIVKRPGGLGIQAQ